MNATEEFRAKKNSQKTGTHRSPRRRFQEATGLGSRAPKVVLSAPRREGRSAHWPFCGDPERLRSGGQRAKGVEPQPCLVTKPPCVLSPEPQARRKGGANRPPPKTPHHQHHHHQRLAASSFLTGTQIRGFEKVQKQLSMRIDWLPSKKSLGAQERTTDQLFHIHQRLSGLFDHLGGDQKADRLRVGVPRFTSTRQGEDETPSTSSRHASPSVLANPSEKR